MRERERDGGGSLERGGKREKERGKKRVKREIERPRFYISGASSTIPSFILHTNHILLNT